MSQKAPNREEQRERYRELLEELRTVMPGAQVLLAFLLTVPFATKFHRLDDVGRNTYAGVVFCAALATILFMTPAAYHRVARRQDRAERLDFAIRIVILGMALLALAIGGAIFVVVRFVFDDTALGLAFGGIASLTAATLWYVLPSLHRN
ncbi:MAG: DUF6328 family protein [Acidimicrobiia bacterium]